ncbi:unnamed protein product [Rotaria socialis]|uniref:SH3 domain-containing protein n=1 Tax=Rotaria socialis TaxID=392032 RepID=A0A820J6D3_9BILA|nr:unnamed protein product [Rotaria socialis]CAF4319070.1 unnamed protein product [Rotaria socialis]
MQLAVALYSNNVDDEDELEFRRGDILTVLIENPNGFDGWWLCKNKEKYGLCPGNRLKLIQNTESPPIKLNDYLDSHSRLSTASMYDDPSKNYDNTTASSSSNYEYDNSSSSNFICNSKGLDSSPESSICSSGIYSANDLHLSPSSSSDFYAIPSTSNSLSSIDLDQLRNSFQKLSIRSSILDKYCQLTLKINIESKIYSFITECYLFLQNHGCLLDRYTYRLIKENYLHELEHTKKQTIELATKIIQLIKSTIDLRVKQKSNSNSSISNDVFKKLHLEPIAEIPQEKINTSLSTTQIHRTHHNENHQKHLKTSKTCFSNFLLSSSSIIPSNDNDSLDDIDSKSRLIKCYYRHVNEQVNSIIKRFSYLLDAEHHNIPSLTIDGKALIVAAHKLVFVLETLHEHVQQIRTSLVQLTTQLCEALKSFIQLLKELSQNNSNTLKKFIVQFQSIIKTIMNIVQRIKQQCSVV